ncbi:hypothetical protein PUNSTDRAFT_143172 [Punctularia strigosozonata HHB-11173 SS5]|uniref:uncharacterized protein n=1 Tax=Punctularia strigosozonata (strain HHB-11173) TaxID=741275 RepID=UPI00044180C4|nr:uncharacterized protein PUNSTDRAFT_143172 [Punctularia strigosozonata HHB-11173 SS5]EIN09707.1 hypothetical protein PUNSTDRAFT_143172 [Punctularia strigosozonata HHB-11173 SS5]
MHQGGRGGVVPPPLALAMPRPHLVRTRSGASRSSLASPRTPSCRSPVPSAFFCPGSRKSTDSWGSSVDGDEPEFEWQTDQVLLLSRTLDALPAHILTPFNGSVPPANLLDKVARGVAQAKGPEQWPHSVRATRAKLLELAKSRAKEERQKLVLREEEEHPLRTGSPMDVLRQSTNTPDRPAGRSKLPLYRQSSMDFMQSARLSGSSDRMARLTSRLQRVANAHPSSYHPYSRPRPRSPSPNSNEISNSNSTGSTGRTELSLGPTLISSTPSSTTLNSSSVSSRLQTDAKKKAAQRSSTSSDGSGLGWVLDPRIQRIRRSDSFSSLSASNGSPRNSGVYALNVPPILKRAASYSTISTTSSDGTKISVDPPTPSHLRTNHNNYFTRPQTMGHNRIDSFASTSSTSSDEEDKARTKLAKKMRVKSPSPTPTAPPCTPGAPAPALGQGKSSTKTRRSQLPTLAPSKGFSTPQVQAPTKKIATLSPSTTQRPRLRQNVQRNPSMLGPELPKIPASPSPTTETPALRAKTATPAGGASVKRKKTSGALSPASPGTPPPPTPASPSLSPGQHRPLRRMKAIPLKGVPHLAKRISFGSLAAPREEAPAPVVHHLPRTDDGNGLGSAFQLH